MEFVIIDDDISAAIQLQDLILSVRNEYQDPSFDQVNIIASGERFDLEYVDSAHTCIITEVDRPDVDGISLSKKLRMKDIDVPIVFCTSTNDHAMQCYDLDLTYYLLKPVTLQSVKKMLDRLEIRVMGGNL